MRSLELLPMGDQILGIGHYLDAGSPMPGIPFGLDPNFQLELPYMPAPFLPFAVKDDLDDQHHETTLLNRLHSDSPSAESKRRGAGRQFEDDDDAKERKKQIDKRYRDRLKNEKQQTKQQLDDLRGENESLKKEIEELRGQNGMISQNMDSNSEKMNQLSNSHNQLKREFTRQESFVQALLQKLAPDGQSNMMNEQGNERIDQLKEALMSQDMKAVFEMCHELCNENMRLERENLVLQVKVEALCEKIHNDKHLELDGLA